MEDAKDAVRAFITKPAIVRRRSSKAGLPRHPERWHENNRAFFQAWRNLWLRCVFLF